MKVIYKILYTPILKIMKALHILGLVGQQTCDNCIWLNNGIQTWQGIRFKVLTAVTNDSSLVGYDTV